MHNSKVMIKITQGVDYIYRTTTFFLYLRYRGHTGVIQNMNTQKIYRQEGQTIIFVRCGFLQGVYIACNVKQWLQ